MAKLTNSERMFGKDTEGVWERILCIDPGTKRTGLAYWSILRCPTHQKKCLAPCRTKLLKQMKGIWEERVDVIVEEFQATIEEWGPRYVVIESQELWTGSAKSMASSARGEVFKVSYLAGQFGRVVRVVTGRRAILVTPTVWKGQLSKRAVDLRIKRALGETYPPDISDAVGMGLAIQGRL